MEDSIRMIDVARRAGVNSSTVSLALRNNPRISAATRVRIQALAQELGYNPNPLVSALMRSRRNARAGRTIGSALAYLHVWPEKDGWKHVKPQFYPSAAAKAQSLGYRLEPFWLGQPGLRSERLAEILRNRGIQGILVCPPPVAITRIDFPWQEHTTVILGVNIRAPLANRVAHNHFADASLAFRQAKLLGLTRLGMVMTSPTPAIAVDRYIGGFLSVQRHETHAARIPIHYEQSLTPGGLTKWMTRHEPDAIITTEHDALAAMLDTCAPRKLRNITVINLTKPVPTLDHAGIYHDPNHVGVHAVNLLVGALSLNERGLPQEPCESLISGVWSPGGPPPGRARSP